MLRDLLGPVDFFCFQKLQEEFQVALISRDCPGGQAPFVFQVNKEVVDMSLHTRSAYTRSPEHGVAIFFTNTAENPGRSPFKSAMIPVRLICVVLRELPVPGGR